MQKKIKVGVFFGGISPEHEVSWNSARGIIANLDTNRFQVVQILIDKKGKFWTARDFFQPGAKKQKVDINHLVNMIDVAFPVLHGLGGEDGAIQGFFQTLQISFVGADVLSSAIGLDKGVFNQLMLANNIRKCRFVVLDFQRDASTEIQANIAKVSKSFIFPVFVKAARGGSSLGVYLVKQPGNLVKMINKSKSFDKKIVIEEAVPTPIEVEISVLGNARSDYQVSLPGRVIPGAEFYDYDDKYFDNKTKFELPANLPAAKIKEIQRLALQVYKIVNCRGLARVDFLLDKRLNVFINEINTLPGFTAISMYPKLWDISGLKYKPLLTKLISLALKKY